MIAEEGKKKGEQEEKTAKWGGSQVRNKKRRGETGSR